MLSFGKRVVSLCVVLLLYGCGSSSSGNNNTESETLPVVMIGPSTVYIVNEFDKEVHDDGSSCTLEGWGEVIGEYAKDDRSVYNYARPGASAASFKISPDNVHGDWLLLYGPNRDHYWAKTKEKMQSLKKGFLLIQFGGNDIGHLQSKYPLRDENNQIIDYNKDGKNDFSDNDKRWDIIYNEFQSDVKFYIGEARALNFTPVLITSPNARELQNGKIVNSRMLFPQKMKELGQKEGVRVLDLHEKTLKEYNSFLENSTYEELNKKFGDCLRQNGSRDYTHFEENGAKTVARWIKDMACEDADSLLCKQFR